MEYGKAPDFDGLPMDFYKAFCSAYGEDVLDVFNGCAKRGVSPLSCRGAVLTVVPKMGLK